MPTYVYENKEGEQFELIMRIAEMSERQFKEGSKDYIMHEGQKCKRIFVSNMDCAGTWPMIATFAGINPNQIKQFQEEEKRLGIPTEYTKHGDPVIRDKGHYKAYLKSRNLFDRDACYSGATPTK